MFKKTSSVLACLALVALPTAGWTATQYRLVRSCTVPGVCGTIRPVAIGVNLTLARCLDARDHLTPLWGQFPYNLSCLPM